MHCLEKTKENVKKHKDIKLLTTGKGTNYLMSESNCHTTKFFYRKSVSNIKKEKTQILIDKPVYFGFLTLELSEILMHNFWHDYVKPKYEEQEKLCI